MTLQFSTDRLTIRPAEDRDVIWGADLMFSAGPGLFSYAFASTPDGTKEILRQVFREPSHAFSYEFAQVLEVDDRSVGIVLGYPGVVKRKAEANVQGIMAHVIPLHRVPRILGNLADMSRIKQDVGPDMFFLLSLCIVPEFRNRGLGTVLLKDIEWTAKDLGCKSVGLDMAYRNDRARRLFERQGYKVTCSKTSQRFSSMTDAGGLHRLEKKIQSVSKMD